VSSVLRRVSAGAAAWTVGAAAAVAVSMLALTVIGGVGGDVQPPAPMPALDNGLAGAANSDSASPSPSGTATPSATDAASARPPSSAAATPSSSPAQPSPTPGPPRQFTTSAGVLTGQCIGQLAYLVSWSPAPGYRVDDVRRGPTTVARVTFVMSATHQDVAFGVQCTGGVPQLVHVHE
jgi:hypothetical protein